MEALAAINLASSIVQFVDFATKLTKGTRQIYQSGAGAAGETADLEVCAAELDALCSRLQCEPAPSTRNADDEALVLLASQCQSIATELATLLRKIKAKNPDSRRSCFVSALRTQLSSGEREGLSRRLSECRAQLNIQLSHLANRDTKALHDQVQRALQSSETNFNSLLDVLRGIRDNVTTSLLDPRAEAHLRKLLSLPEDSRKGIIAQKVLNLLQFDNMSEHFDDVVRPLDGTFSWWLEEQVVPVVDATRATAPSRMDRISDRISPKVRPELSLFTYANPTDQQDLVLRTGVKPSSQPVSHSPARQHSPSDPTSTLDAAEITRRAGLPEWLQSGSGTYHIVGPPGSGKSTFLKYIYQDPNALHFLQKWAVGRKPILVKFFFNSKGDKKHRSIAGLCRAILHDILQQCPELVPQALPSLWSQVESAPWQVEVKAQLQHDEVCGGFETLLRAGDLGEHHVVCIFIDALDQQIEENLNHTSLVHMLTRWTDAAPSDVKICASSRPDVAFLEKIDARWRLWIDQHTSSDIRKLVQHILESSSRPFLLPGKSAFDSLHSIVDQIALRSRGNFRWAILASHAVLSYGSTYRVPSTSPSNSSFSHTNAPALLDTSDPNLTLTQILQQENAPLSPEYLDKQRDLTLSWPQRLDKVPDGTLTLRRSPTQGSNRYKRRYKELQMYLGVTEEFKNDLAIAEEDRLIGTCEWFADRQSFCKWWDPSDTSARVLWVKGNPASGKSTLAGWIINWLQDRKAACSYFFFKHGDASKSTLTSCLRALAYQMACEEPGDRTIHDALITMKEDDNGRLSDGQESVRAIWRKLFTDCILRKPFKRHFWVIDALDECENAMAAFHSILGKRNQGLPLRVLVTSRETKEFLMAFKDLGAEQITIKSSDTAGDIKKLVEHRSSAINTKSKDAQADLANTILRKSEGSFMWTELVLKELSRANSEKEVAAMLKHVPKGMEKMYERTLSSMSRAEQGKSLAKAILTWVSCAKRPLTTAELKAALDLDLEEDLAPLEVSVPTHCGRIVNVDTFGKVRLIHETVREFLQSSDLKSEFAVQPTLAHSRLASVCLRFLTSDAMKAPRGTRRLTAQRPAGREPAMLPYACQNFSHHLARADVRSGDQLVLLERFLKEHVPSWIENVASASDNLSALMQASKDIRIYLGNCVADSIPCNDVLRLAELWSIDLERVIAKFGDAIVTYPRAIHTLVPPLCPANSQIRKTAMTARGLSVIGLTDTDWDDHLVCIDHHAQTHSVAYGIKFFAVGLRTGLIATYRTTTGQAYKEFQHGSGERVDLLCFINDAGLLASYGRKSLKIWNLDNGTVLSRFEAVETLTNLVHYRTEDVNLLVGTTIRNYLVLWDLNDDARRLPDRPWNTGEESGAYCLRDQPYAVSISIEHKLLAAAYNGRPIILWDLESDEFFGTCGEIRHRTQSIVFSESAELLAVSDLDGTLVLLNPFNGDTLHHTRANCPQLAASPDGRLLAGLAGSGAIHIYKFDTTLQLLYKVQSRNTHIKHLAFSHDGLRFVDIRTSLCNLWSPTVLRRTEADSGSSLVSKDNAHSGVKFEVITILIHPEGRYIYCGCSDGSVLLHDLSNGNKIGTLYRHNLLVRFITQLSTEGAIMSIDSSNSMLAHKIERDSRGIRLGRKIFQERLEGEQTITQVLASKYMSKFILSTRESDHLWTTDGQEQHAMSHSLEPGIRKWAQHPRSNSHVIRHDSSTLRVYTWNDWSEVARTNTSLPTINTQLKSLTPYTVGSTPSFLVELSTLNGNNDTRDLFTLETRHFDINEPTPKPPQNPSASPPPTALLRDPFLQRLATRVAHVLSILDNGNLLFLDKQSWVCSVRLASIGQPSFEYCRHFFVPADWVSGMRQVVGTVVGRQVVFGKNGGIVIFNRGLEHKETVFMEDSAVVGAADV